MDFNSAWQYFADKWASRPIPKKGIALALGGGAVLGAAHVGVIKAFEENNIKIRAISGTSIGAMIATLYAFGKTPNEIEEIVGDFDWLNLTSFTLSKFGMLSNGDLGKKLKEILGDVTFQDAHIPLSLVATDLSTGQRVVLNQGNVSQSVMASSAIPGVFVPVEIDDYLLADGGLIENVPVSPLRELGEDFIIGVDLNAGRNYHRPDDIVDVLVNAIDIAIDNVTKSQTSEADLVIAPELSSYSRRDTSRVQELIDEGYRCTMHLLKEQK